MITPLVNSKDALMAMKGEGPLPSFKKPPVGEVALILQFLPIEGLRNTEILRFWMETELREQFPTVGVYAQLPSFRESFHDVPRRTTARPRFVESSVVRYNFRNETLREQVQIQQDRIAFYWQEGSRNYPRFGYILERMRGVTTLFKRFLSELSLGELLCDQCAISYTNPIRREQGWSDIADLARVVTFWKAPPYDVPLPADARVESIGHFESFVLRDASGSYARMYVTLDRMDATVLGVDAVALELLVRGAPRASNLENATEFFEMGHECIVRTFAAITTAEMHERWEREQ